ncbi:MAG: FAD-dependent oxidoreductase [Smithellaceae bacterium]
MDDTISALFNPLNIGSLTLKNRIMFPAVGEIVLDDKQSQFLALRAKGGVGLIVVPGGMITDDIQDGLFHFYSDKCIPEVRKIVQAIHAKGAKAGIQIVHEGRQSRSPSMPVAPSPIPWSANGRIPRELAAAEIDKIIEDFSEAIRRARDIGFDMVEIHGAHGYLVSQFLSARSNKRKDQYGGDIGNRARFLVEIIQRAHEKVGSSFPICCRLNAADYIEGGQTIEDTVSIARLIEQAGVSMISLSAGVYGYPVTIAPFYSPRAMNADLARQVKAAVKIPVCVAGRIDSAPLAAQIITEGKADLIALARPLLTDPELPNKIMRGESHRIRPCLYCNNGCMAHQEDRSPLSYCTVNPWLAREELLEIPPAKSLKKVVIIGGGLAGLEAARVASLRGHKVIVYEKKDRLGGQWLLAAVPPSKEHFLNYLKWLINEIELAGVDIRLNTTFTLSELVTETPDTVILATGALPARPPVPGIEMTTTAWEVLQGKVTVGDNVLVIGGNATGLETAHLLAVQGKKVMVIEMTARFGSDMPNTVRWHLRKMLNAHGVEMLPLTKLKQIVSEGEVLIETKEGEKLLSSFSNLILATGVRPCNDLKSSLEPVVRELHVIGDSSQPRSGLEAIAEGAKTGLLI